MLNDNLKEKNEYFEKCHKHLLVLLKYLDKICSENNVKYTLSSGTLIGAVREHGFIPWDDDGDINFIREEYEKFIKVLKNTNLPSYIGVYYPEKQKSFLDYTVRLYYKEEKLRSDDSSEKKYNGIYSYSTLDIFVLDNIPDNVILKRLYVLKQQIIFGLAMSKREDIKYNKYNLFTKLSIFFLSKIGKLFSLQKIIAMHDKASMSYRYDNKANLLYCTMWPPVYPGWQFEKNWFDEYIYVKFEDTDLMITKEYHKVLTVDYGDYMTPIKTHQHDDFIEKL